MRKVILRMKKSQNSRDFEMIVKKYDAAKHA